MTHQTKFKAACIQVNATDDMAANIRTASQLTRDAVADGANFVLMPENVSMMEWGKEKI